jgi:hypothetical protein
MAWNGERVGRSQSTVHQTLVRQGKVFIRFRISTVPVSKVTAATPKELAQELLLDFFRGRLKPRDAVAWRNLPQK